MRSGILVCSQFLRELAAKHFKVNKIIGEKGSFFNFLVNFALT